VHSYRKLLGDFGFDQQPSCGGYPVSGRLTKPPPIPDSFVRADCKVLGITTIKPLSRSAIRVTDTGGKVLFKKKTGCDI
jgi:hypothetical protein